MTVLSGTTGEVYLVSVSSIPVLPSQISLLGSSDTNLTARIGIGLSQAFIQIENPLLAGSQNTLTLSGTNGLSTLTVRFMVKAYTDVSYSPSQQTLEMVSGFTGAVAGVLQPQGGGLGSFVYALGSETTASQFAINSSSGGLSLIARLAVNALATAVVDVSDNLGGVVYSRAQLTVVVRGVAAVALSSGDTRLNVQTTDTNIALYSVTLSGGRAASALRLSQQGSSNAALTAVIRNNTIAVVSLATNLAVGVHSVTLQGTDGVSSLTTQIAVNSFVAINYANALQTLSVATGATLVLAAATPRNGVGAQRYSLIAGTSANRFSVVVGSGELQLTAGLTGIAPANLATAVVEVSDSLSKATLSVIVESYQLSFGGANLIVARVLEEANPTGVLGESVRLTVLSGTTGEVYLVSVSSIPVLPSQISLLGSSDTNLTARIGIGLSQAFIQIENPLLAGSQNTLTLSGTNGLSTLTVRFMVKAYTDVSYSHRNKHWRWYLVSQVQWRAYCNRKAAVWVALFMRWVRRRPQASLR